MIIIYSQFIVICMLTVVVNGSPVGILVTPEVSSARSKVEETPGAFEGDIILPKTARGVAAIGPTVRWPDGIVPYQFGSGHSASDQAVIVDAMRRLENWVAMNNSRCIQFRPREVSDVYYITFVNGSGCSSPIGRHQRNVTLQSPGCIDYGRIIHELMHTLGFYHEQSRPDRDSYVQVFTQNIQSGLEGNFNKYSNTAVDTLNTSYDYISLMHYETTAFSVNGSPTIQPLQANTKIGQRYKMSDIDIQEIRLFYNCSTAGSPLPANNTGLITVSTSSNITIYSSSLTTWHPIYARRGGDGSNYYYETIRVFVPSAGTWLFKCNSDIDTFAAIYYTSFNASDPESNFFASYDDAYEGDWQCGVRLTFPSAFWIDFIMTTYNQGVSGWFSLMATGPGPVNFTSLTIVTTPATTTPTSSSTISLAGD